VYRIMVEILDENDNLPVFPENTVQSVNISELTPVDTVVFTVKAIDPDDDRIIYSIDQTSPDAQYFKVELPNSGEVVLSKPLDFEIQSQLVITIHASETSTEEHFNTSTTVTITVLDGDDQYPQFLPCTAHYRERSNPICTNPVYTANVTEEAEDIVLDFSPGPIRAVDGDRGLNTPLSYTIISGDDDGRFLMDRETGEVRLTWGVKDRLTISAFHLQVMAYQDDDPRKYTVTTATIRVLAANHFPPEFEATEYHGFVMEDKSIASLVNTYGSRVLMLRAHDPDFMHGFNPMIYFSFSPMSNHTDLYQVTPQGLLIARANQLTAKQKHILEVMAVDQESGDATYATIVVEVLPEGQLIPYSPYGEERITGCTVGKALTLCVFFMTILGCILRALSWGLKKHKGLKDPWERGCVAQGKHPNVSLKCFQMLNHRSGLHQMEEVDTEELGTYNPSFTLQEKPATYPSADLPPCRGPTPPGTNAVPNTNYKNDTVDTEDFCSPVEPVSDNASPLIKCSASLPAIRPTVIDVSFIDMARNSAPPKERLGSQSPQPDTEQDAEEAPESPPPHDATTAATVPPSTSQGPSSPATAGEASQSPPSPKQTSTPPPTPEHAPLLVDIDGSPDSTPPVTPEGEGTTSSPEALSQVDHPSASSGQGPSADAGDDDLDPDEEELLRVMARLHPMFIEIKK